MKLKLQTQIFIGLGLGVLVGWLFKEQAPILEPIGDLFIRLLKMVIAPLVFASLVTGIVSIGSVRSLGRLGAKTFLYYLTTTMLSVSVGLVLVNLLKPGFGADITGYVENAVEGLGGETPSLLDTFIQIVPKNVIGAMAQDQMLSIIFFSLMFGGALAALGRKAEPINRFVETLNDVMLKMTDWILAFMPIGVFALVATLVSATGFATFKPLAMYMIVVLAGLGIHMLVNLPILVVVLAQYSPITLIRNMVPAIATAFSTGSSVATLPVTMDCLEKRVGVSNRVTGFVAPLGATMNMDGTAMYQAVAAVFIAQVYGIQLPISAMIAIFITATLASIGTAALPSAGLITMAMVLRSVDVPLDGISIIIAVDRILDMCRTTVNAFSDACGATIVARSEGERLKA